MLFWFSGIQEVEPDQVGLLLRFGKLHGAHPAAQVHEPGLLLALPYPIDRVIQVPAKQEGEVVIKEVWKGIEETGRSGPHRPGAGRLLPDRRSEHRAGSSGGQVPDQRSGVLPAGARPIRPPFCTTSCWPRSTQTVTGWNVNDVLRLQRQDPQRPGPDGRLGGQRPAAAPSSGSTALDCGIDHFRAWSSSSSILRGT